MFNCYYRGEYSCPLCRQLANSIMPLIPPTGDPQQKQSGVGSSNPKNKINALSDALNRLTEIINTTPPSNNVCSNESSNSSNQVAILKHTYSLHEHIHFRFLPDKTPVIQVSIGNHKIVLK